MPVQTCLLPEQSLIYVHYSGVITRSEMRASLSYLYNSADFRPGMSEIDDLRAMTDFDFNFDSMMAYTDDVTRNNLGSEDATKVAVLEGDDLAFGMARMFQSLAEASGAQVDVQIFSDAQDALTFLDMPEFDLDQLIATLD